MFIGASLYNPWDARSSSVSHLLAWSGFWISRFEKSSEKPLGRMSARQTCTAGDDLVSYEKSPDSHRFVCCQFYLRFFQRRRPRVSTSQWLYSEHCSWGISRRPHKRTPSRSLVQQLTNSSPPRAFLQIRILSRTLQPRSGSLWLIGLCYPLKGVTWLVHVTRAEWSISDFIALTILVCHETCWLACVSCDYYLKLCLGKNSSEIMTIDSHLRNDSKPYYSQPIYRPKVWCKKALAAVCVMLSASDGYSCRRRGWFQRDWTVSLKHQHEELGVKNFFGNEYALGHH